MEFLANSMTHKFSDHGKPRILDHGLNGRREIAQPFPFAKLVNPSVERISSHLHQTFSCFTHLSYRHGHRSITVKTVHNDSKIHPQDISLFEDSFGRHAMNDLFVHRGT